jgi:hypothetical protein
MNLDVASSTFRFSRFRELPAATLRALLKAQELLGLALGLSFLEFRENHGRLGSSFVEAKLDALSAQDATLSMTRKAPRAATPPLHTSTSLQDPRAQGSKQLVRRRNRAAILAFPQHDLRLAR